MFAINATDPAPIWRQIEEGVRRLIALGALQPGASVPSVRDLAKDLRVNPNTVARAYQRLTEGGVLSVKRGATKRCAMRPRDMPRPPSPSARRSATPLMN
jgi:GntR family transcriptional regulator